MVGKIGYAPAPIETKPDSGWLYTWSLGHPQDQRQPGRGLEVHLLDDRQGLHPARSASNWAGSGCRPGSRLSTYQIPQYREASAAYGPPTLASMAAADPEHPTVQPVPYTGIQFLTIPEFQDLGTRVSQQISAAIAGQISRWTTRSTQAQQYAEAVGKTYQEEQ